jgi:hypothetical protein
MDLMEVQIQCSCQFNYTDVVTKKLLDIQVSFFFNYMHHIEVKL